MLNYGNKHKYSLKHAKQVQVAGNLEVLGWLEDRWVLKFAVSIREDVYLLLCVVHTHLPSLEDGNPQKKQLRPIRSR